MSICSNIRVTVLGVGYWGPNLVRNVASHPQAELVGTSDTTSEALERMAAQYPRVPLFERLDDTLAESPAEAVVIAAPSGLHYEHASLACTSL